jgi:phage I-like protein
MQKAAAHKIEITDGQPPEWVQLLPMGVFTGRDGLGPHVLDRPDAVIAATLNYQRGAEIPIDYDHQSLYVTGNGQPALAAGWIKELQARDDGIWARVEWTPVAAERIAAREYRYLSPVYAYSKPGTVLRIVCAALTNMPNLELQAVASQAIFHNQKESPMPTLKERLVAALAMKPDSDDDAIESQCLSLKTAMEAIGSAVGITEGGSDAIVVAASQAITTPDPRKFVPADQYQAVASQLTQLQASVNSEKASVAVTAAMAAGKLAPAQKDWAIAFASRDLSEFEAFVATAPVILAAHSQNQFSSIGTSSLTEAEQAACRQLGLSSEEFRTTKQQENR